MKHLKLIISYTVEVGSNLTTLFIYLFFRSHNQRAKAGCI